MNTDSKHQTHRYTVTDITLRQRQDMRMGVKICRICALSNLYNLRLRLHLEN